MNVLDLLISLQGKEGHTTTTTALVSEEESREKRKG